MGDSATKWTNKSVKAFAQNAEPIQAIQDAARKLVLEAREKGWQGPPFNPLHIVEMLGARVEANSNISDARLSASDDGPVVEFNPRQPRERVRFSIAHEIAHMLFPDWKDRVRNRGGNNSGSDDWQLEMLCNLAASEFVLPIGSLPATSPVPTIEELMKIRREYDVSAEAFLIRLAKIADEPIGVFFASPRLSSDSKRSYRVDYLVSSPTAPKVSLTGLEIPQESIVQNCTAIGQTNAAIESWALGVPTKIECVGIPGFPGTSYPRVGGVIRFDVPHEERKPIRYVHGNVLDPKNGGRKIVCQLVNDKATKWGGGVARKAATRFPEAEKNFSQEIIKIPKAERLGKVIFVEAEAYLEIASIIAQEGFGKSLFPRIRYASLQHCLEVISKRAIHTQASIHMPRIGTGVAGGDWNIIQELLDDILVRSGIIITIYDPPPKRKQLELF